MALKQIALKGFMGFSKVLYSFLNFLLPKHQDRIVVLSIYKIEENGLAMANYIAENYDKDIAIVFPNINLDPIREFIHPRIKILTTRDIIKFNKTYIKFLCGSKYIFYTHNYPYQNFSNRQKLINIWHGVGYKIGFSGDPKTSLTIASSPMSKTMFAEIFQISEDDIFIGGLPRLDIMLNAQKEKDKIKKERLPQFNKFSKILIWMPTFRRSTEDSFSEDGIQSEIDNVFNIQNFKATEFNQLLKRNNTICFIKTHYFVKKVINSKEFSHIQIIDDTWLQNHNILLYQFLACTDALITDYSSVMIDYSLLEQPIFCIADDLEDFKKSQGLYFDDYENWVPTKLFQNQNDFLSALSKYFKSNTDAYEAQRKDIRNEYFQYHDANSAKRIAEHVLGT